MIIRHIPPPITVSTREEATSSSLSSSIQPTSSYTILATFAESAEEKLNMFKEKIQKFTAKNEEIRDIINRNKKT